MLDRSDVDAVVIGTPMQLHASQAVAALERGVHVLSEVTAGVSLEECEALVRACRESSGHVHDGGELYVQPAPTR